MRRKPHWPCWNNSARAKPASPNVAGDRRNLPPSAELRNRLWDEGRIEPNDGPKILPPIEAAIREHIINAANLFLKSSNFVQDRGFRSLDEYSSF